MCHSRSTFARWNFHPTVKSGSSQIAYRLGGALNVAMRSTILDAPLAPAATPRSSKVKKTLPYRPAHGTWHDSPLTVSNPSAIPNGDVEEVPSWMRNHETPEASYDRVRATPGYPRYEHKHPALLANRTDPNLLPTLTKIPEGSIQAHIAKYNPIGLGWNGHVLVNEDGEALPCTEWRGPRKVWRPHQPVLCGHAQPGLPPHSSHCIPMQQARQQVGQLCPDRPLSEDSEGNVPLVSPNLPLQPSPKQAARPQDRPPMDPQDMDVSNPNLDREAKRFKYLPGRPFLDKLVCPQQVREQNHQAALRARESLAQDGYATIGKFQLHVALAKLPEDSGPLPFDISPPSVPILKMRLAPSSHNGWWTVQSQTERCERRARSVLTNLFRSSPSSRRRRPSTALKPNATARAMNQPTLTGKFSRNVGTPHASWSQYTLVPGRKPHASTTKCASSKTSSKHSAHGAIKFTSVKPRWKKPCPPIRHREISHTDVGALGNRSPAATPCTCL